MIGKLKKIFETQTTILQKKAGVFKEEEIECAIDNEIVSCSEVDSVPFIGEDTTNYHEWIEEELEEKPYTGVPAPDYLQPDPWFSSDPVRSEKQLDYMEQETEIKKQEEENRQYWTNESENIHQEMYELATKSCKTTTQLNPVGGSETFQEGPGDWMSGSGFNQYRG